MYTSLTSAQVADYNAIRRAVADRLTLLLAVGVAPALAVPQAQDYVCGVGALRRAARKAYADGDCARGDALVAQVADAKSGGVADAKSALEALGGRKAIPALYA